MAALTVGLVGNPNSGKTTLFNALTGARQKVGNWPGVTVERKSGVFSLANDPVTVIDLPGVYSLTIVSDTTAIDERITCNYVLSQEADVIVNVLDAAHLERSLYVTLQLLEMRIPLVVAVNMLDVVKSQGHQILLKELAGRLGCSVVGLSANRSVGIAELKKVIQQARVAPAISYQPSELMTIVKNLTAALSPPEKIDPTWLAIHLLEDDKIAQQLVSADVMQHVIHAQTQIKQHIGEDPDIVVAEARYQTIADVMKACFIKANTARKTMTAYLDQIILNRVLGIPIFLAVMYGMFLFAINVGGAFQDFFDMSGNALFVEGPAHLLKTLHAPHWLIALIANGIGNGINTTLTFIPVIGAMFLFLAFLEDSGYMPRAAFVVDRLMRALGLPGKSFVPMIVGFGCNVPAVMGARTLQNKRDRILTVMMTPFMSCGARLAIYAVFVAAFFPKGGHNVVFSLYLLGITMAMLTGLLLRKTVLQGEPAPLMMELPLYHVPRIKTLLLLAWQRLQAFVWRAGKLIVPVCVVIGVLGSLTIDGSMSQGDGDAHSLLALLGRYMTPVFTPMGITSDNWPATVGLLTGVLAKEVVIGTLNALYTSFQQVNVLPTSDFNVWQSLHDAVISIPANLSQLVSALYNPWLAEAPVENLDQGVYGVMYQQFDGQIGAMAYLIFVLLYFPCVSTIAAIARELNRGWATFSVLWTTGSAYGIAVLFYQLATFMRHPASSFVWVLGVALVFISVIVAMRIYSGQGVFYKSSDAGQYVNSQ